MEPHYGAHLDGDWDFAQQFLVQILNDHEQASTNPVRVDESSLYSLHASNITLQYDCQNGGNGNVFIPTFHNDSFGHVSPDHVLVSEDMNSLPMDVNMIHPEKICAAFPPEAIEENVSVNAVQELELKRKFDVPNLMSATGDHVATRLFKNAKKLRISACSSKSQKLSPTCKENCDAHSYNSEKENASQELKWAATSDSKASAALYSNGKTRASRGSATDPQSLYARRRREKINQRIRILQSLVPNGTKVDICTMLEEAVHYVKFLQLQIRLLSSDDMWMYAPIVYSGMDYGFNQNISPS